MNPIRVAHILPFQNIGGTEKATLRLAEAAVFCGFENILYCPENAAGLRQFFQDSCFPTRPYRQVEPSYHRPLPYLRAALQLARDLRRHNVRIVHCADILGAHYTALAGRLAGAFVVSHVRCRHSVISRRDQTFLFPVQKFVFVSRDTWNSFGMQVSCEQGEVLYEGLPETGGSPWSPGEARSFYGLPPGAPVVGMASRVHPGKDFETLIQAAKQIVAAAPSTRFLIAGDHREQQVHRDHFLYLQSILRQAGLERVFHFVGFERDMARFFAAINVFVLSTHAEGLPLVILEAMSHAKPVVATNIGGIPEVIIHEQNGLLVPAKSPDDLAQALLSLLRDGSRAVELGHAGCEHVQRHFSHQQFQKRVKELYCNIARQKGLAGEAAPCTPT